MKKSLVVLFALCSVAKSDANFCITEVVMKGKSCFVTAFASIKKRDYKIQDEESEDVQTIDFQGNKNVSFLPIKVFRKFPNLESYLAGECNVGEISQVNFENLFHLRELNLQGNRIETVQRDTFMFLCSVRRINLSKLKF